MTPIAQNREASTPLNESRPASGGHGEPLSEPWLASVDRVAEWFGTDRANGLSAEEAAARLERIGPNRLDPGPTVPAWKKLLSQFADPLVYLLLAAVAISIVSWVVEGAEGVPFDSVVIAVILFANAILGFAQEAKAERAVAALQKMSATTSTVVRDGENSEIPADEIVPGDVIRLAEGDSVSADARLVEAANLTIAEAALTGESEPVSKSAGCLDGDIALGDRLNMAFSGTAVTRGRGTAIVTSTGMSTEIGRIAVMLEATEEEPTPLEREIARVGRMLGLAVLVIAAIVVAAIVLTSDLDDTSDVVDVLLVGVSLAVAAVPEGLPAVLSVVLAIGVQRMAAENAIVKRLSSVETLGSASVICTDKTGTLTRNEMTIEQVITRSGVVDIPSGPPHVGGSLTVDGGPLGEGATRDEVRVVLGAGSLASDASLREVDGALVAHGDPTEVAFLVAERRAGFHEERIDRFERVGEVPFTSERKVMSTLQVDHHRDDLVGVVAKGAPDVLLAKCTHELSGTDAVPLDDARRREILRTVDELAGEAYRTLGVAYRPLDDMPEDIDEDVERELIFAGIAAIIDPPRSEAKAAIDEARNAGIRVVMITGDHPKTAARIASDLGIIRPGDRTVSGLEIDRTPDDEFRALARETSVYARVAPEHKLRIVDALQKDGNIAAMTGDGVNDAPALKRADIGVAMGIAGTDVTKEAAKMILADDNFATIVSAVREGRAIFANIRKFLRYLLSSNAGEVLTMFFGVVAAGVVGLETADGNVAVPLLATQILWINLLTDTGPALAMGVDPPPDDVMSHPPRGLDDRVIDREMQIGVAFIGLVMAVVTLLTLDIALPRGLIEGDGTLTEARTMAFTTLVLAQLFNCFNARSDRTSAFHHLFTNPLLWGAIALSLALQFAVVYLPVLNEAFSTTALGLGDWLLCTVMASAVLWADEARKLVTSQRRAPRPAGRSAARSAELDAEEQRHQGGEAGERAEHREART